MTNSDTIRLGIIGAGEFARVHMEAFRQIDGVDVVAFCRRDEAALAAMQAEWAVPNGFTDYRDLLAMGGLDAVAIVTPTAGHHPMALAAAAAGKHILCEKPLGLTSGQCAEMLAAADAAGVVHCVNFNQRARIPVGRMRAYMDEGFVGRLYHLNIWWGISLQDDLRDVGSWRYRPETGGGTIYELIHVLDMALFLGGPVSRICCLAPTLEPRRTFADVPQGMDVTVPDSSAFLTEFADGGYGVLHTSFVARGHEDSEDTAARVEVTGERGRLVTRGLHGLRGISGREGPLEDLDGGGDYPYPYRQFVDAILTGTPVKTSFAAGLEAARLADAARLSAAQGRWVDMAPATG